MPEEGEVKTAVADTAREYLMNVRHLKDVRPMQEKLTCPYIKKCFIETVSMSDGKVIFHLEIDQKYYYELLSEWMGMPVKGRLRFLQDSSPIVGKSDSIFSGISGGGICQSQRIRRGGTRKRGGASGASGAH